MNSLSVIFRYLNDNTPIRGFNRGYVNSVWRSFLLMSVTLTAEGSLVCYRTRLRNGVEAQ